MSYDWARLCEDVRSTTLDVAADCVETYSRARWDGGCAERSYDPCTGRSDFLYDIVHLSVTYWMQLARLGSSYSVYAQRAVGALYGSYASPACAPARCPDPCTELSFEGESGDVQTKFLLVRNRSDTEHQVSLELSKFKSCSSDDELSATCKFTRGQKDATKVPINGGETARIGVKVTIPDKKRGRYRGQLKITLDGRTATYAVNLCIA
jgi:hypothetical protein